MKTFIFVFTTTLLTCTLALSAEWPADSGTIIAQSSNLGTGYEPSGAVWHTRLNKLIIVGDNGDVSALSSDGNSVTTWHPGGDIEGIAIADANSNFVYLGIEGSNTIKEFNISSGILTGKTWSILTWMNGPANSGLEALTFVPNGKHPYANSSSGGLFYAGMQADGKIYVFDINLSSSGTVTYIDTITPVEGRNDISDLCYNEKTDVLYAIFDSSNILSEMTSDGTIINEYSMPGNDQEGIAINPLYPIRKAKVHITEDSGKVLLYNNFPVTYPEDDNTNSTSDNLALTASASASSSFSNGYASSNSTDGIKGIWDQGEWAAQGSWDKNPYIKLSWSSPQTANKIVIYGRPNKEDKIQNAKITLSNGYSMFIGEIPSGGAAKEIYFPVAQITWLELKILETTAQNAGITEIEVYYTSSSSFSPTDDTDNDLVFDVFDEFPEDPSESADTDNDSIGNTYDGDDDNDGVYDSEDDFPYNSSKANIKNDFLISASMPTTWDYTNSWESFISNANTIDILNTCWYTMNSDGTIACEENNTTLIAQIIKLAGNNNIAIIPYINNYTGNDFDPERVNSVLNDPEITVYHIQLIVDEVVSKGYDGINIDYENCNASNRDVFTKFIANLSAALHNHGKILEISVHAKTSEPGTWNGPQAQDWQPLGELVDYFKIMTYDYSWSTSPPGPIAPVTWIEDVTNFAKSLVDSNKILMGVPFYGYDWTGNQGTDKTWEEVQEIISIYNLTPEWNDSAKEPYLLYGNDHTIYYQNAESISYKLNTFYISNVKGISIWRLGAEDPAIWDEIENTLPNPVPSTLIILCLGDSITHGYPYLLEPEKTYPAKLQILLNSVYGNDNCQVTNHGISGFRADQVLAAMQALSWLDIDPDIVLLKIGGNDLSNETLPDKSNFFQVVNQTVAEVQQIINLVKSHTNADGTHPKVILSTFIPVSDYWSTVGLKIYNNSLSAGISGADSIITTNWNDFYDPAAQQAYVSLMADSCHPNETGYSIMAQNWMEAIAFLNAN